MKLLVNAEKLKYPGWADEDNTSCCRLFHKKFLSLQNDNAVVLQLDE